MKISTPKKQLGQFLIEKNLISPEQLLLALEEQRKTGLYLRQIFLNLGYVRQESIFEYFEQEFNIPHVDLSNYRIDGAIIKLVPERLARRYLLIPLFIIRDRLSVALVDPLDTTAVKELVAETGMDVEVCIAAHGDVCAALDRWYGKAH